jgi:23S rRNA (guanosine2251-2'-O)-methyltransferase
MNMEKGDSQKRELLFGINAITTLLEVNSGHRKIYSITISETRKKDNRIEKIKILARKNGVKVFVVPPVDFKEMAPETEKTQNIMAEVSNYNPSDLDNFLKSQLKPGTRLVILDQVTDVGNFGSIIRNCKAFGFDGIIISKKRSVTLGSRASAVSAGSLEGIKIFRVTNLAMTIKMLKSKGFWIYGTTLDEDRQVQDLALTDFAFPMALVLGSEDRGMSRLVTESCDVLISINLTGNMESLNVSVASGIILYHIQEKYREAKK